jgi:hypothetical protein
MLLFNPRSKTFKITSYVVAITMYWQIILPVTAGANAPYVPVAVPAVGGQAAVQADMKQLVDPFTGDFSYNIDLMSVGGFPINLSYNPNILMDQDAGWVGAGWTLNPGSVSRSMRGLPDDFQGDEVIQVNHRKDNITEGRNNLLGFNGWMNSIQLGIGSYRNSYRGAGYKLGLDHSKNLSLEVVKYALGVDLPLTGGIGHSKAISFDTQNGIGLNFAATYTYGLATLPETRTKSKALAGSYNSRQGLISKTMTEGSYIGNFIDGTSTSHSSTISFGTPSYLPTIPTNTVAAG